MDISSYSGHFYGLGANMTTTTRQNVQGTTGEQTQSGVQVVSTSEKDKADDAFKKLMEYFEKTPMQRAFEQWLKSHRISQEQFDAMTPEQKQKIVDEFKKEIEEQLKNKLGASDKAATSAIS